MPILTRPSTPRNDLYRTVTRSTQTSVSHHLQTTFASITAQQLRQTQSKFPEFSTQVSNLVDSYNPDTLSRNLLFDFSGNAVPLQPYYRDNNIVPAIDMTKMEMRQLGIAEEHLDHYINKIENIITHPGKYRAFREKQNRILEVFTLRNLVDDTPELEGQEGVRTRIPLSKFKIVDIWGGLKFNLGTTENQTLNNLSSFSSISSGKYNITSGGYIPHYEIIGRSILMKANSSNHNPERENLKMIHFPYRATTEPNRLLTIPVFFTKRPISANEELRYLYKVHQHNQNNRRV